MSKSKSIQYSSQARCFESREAASRWASDQELAGWVCTKIGLDPVGHVLGSGSPYVCHMRRQIWPDVAPIVNVLQSEVLRQLGYGDGPLVA